MIIQLKYRVANKNHSMNCHFIDSLVAEINCVTMAYELELRKEFIQ